jgi:predicted dehydrogenase
MLKVACVGLGWWSDELAKAVHGKTDKLRIVGGAARTPAKRAAFVERLGVRPYDTYEAVLGDSEIERVILTTPHSLHADHVVAAAKAGKHVFVEKPFALTAASAATAAEVCRRAGVVLAVGHNRRFAPAAVELKRLVDAGILGTILHAEANFSAPSALNYTPERWRARRVESPAGGLAGLGIHIIDALIWLLGPMDRTIYGIAVMETMARSAALGGAWLDWIRWIGAEQMLRGKRPRRDHVRSGDMPDRRRV